jgi:hypothetical protein
LQEAGPELDAVLKRIDEDGLMAPLQVIQTLSTNGVATMGMVKKYLADNLERERREIENVNSLYNFGGKRLTYLEPPNYRYLPERNRKKTRRNCLAGYKIHRIPTETMLHMRPHH